MNTTTRPTLWPEWLLTPTDVWSMATTHPFLTLGCLAFGGIIGHIIHNITH